MNIALVDDRPEALADLSRTLNDYALRRHLRFDLSSFSSGETLLSAFMPHRFSLIFLDVYMEGLSGVDTAERIRSVDEDVTLVFLTTSNDHQSSAIHFHVYDYINKEECPEAVVRVMDRLLRSRGSGEKALSFTADKKEIRLPYRDLVCLTADRNYLVIHSADGKEYRPRMTFSSVRAELEKDGRFLQILRGVLVNMDYITDVSADTCFLRGGIRLPVGLRIRGRIAQTWTNYTFAKIRRESMEGGFNV